MNRVRVWPGFRPAIVTALVAGGVLSPWEGRGADSEPTHAVGAGINYWTTVEDPDLAGVNENGFNWEIAYQYFPLGYAGIELALEIFPEGFGGADSEVVSPQLYILLGSSIYAGVGAGTLYGSGEFANEPFLALRAGVETELHHGVWAEIFGTYRFMNWDGDVTRELNTDLATLGAAMRLEF